MSITFINNQQVSFITDFQLFKMSQALENKEGSKKDEGSICIKCQVRLQKADFESLCPTCSSQNKGGEECISKLSDDKAAGQLGYSTPKKVGKHELTFQRQKQLIEAPRKQRIRRSETAQDQENDKNQPLDLSRRRRIQKIKKIYLKQFFDGDEALKQQFAQISNDDEAQKAKAQQSEQDSNNQQNNLHTKDEIVGKRKARYMKIMRDAQQLDEQQFRPKKRSFEQFIDIGQFIKGRCGYCKKKTGLLGVICSHCHHEYCNKHRLLEDHECVIDLAQETRTKMRELVKNILPKHKGKIPEM